MGACVCLFKKFAGKPGGTWLNTFDLPNHPDAMFNLISAFSISESGGEGVDWASGWKTGGGESDLSTDSIEMTSSGSVSNSSRQTATLADDGWLT